MNTMTINEEGRFGYFCAAEPAEKSMDEIIICEYDEDNRPVRLQSMGVISQGRLTVDSTSGETECV